MNTRHPVYAIIQGELHRQDVPGGHWFAVERGPARALLTLLDGVPTPEDCLPASRAHFVYARLGDIFGQHNHVDTGGADLNLPLDGKLISIRDREAGASGPTKPCSKASESLPQKDRPVRAPSPEPMNPEPTDAQIDAAMMVAVRDILPVPPRIFIKEILAAALRAR